MERKAPFLLLSKNKYKWESTSEPIIHHVINIWEKKIISCPKETHTWEAQKTDSQQTFKELISFRNSPQRSHGSNLSPFWCKLGQDGCLLVLRDALLILNHIQFLIYATSHFTWNKILHLCTFHYMKQGIFSSRSHLSNAFS